MQPTTKHAFKIAYGAYRATRLLPSGVSSATKATAAFWALPYETRQLVRDPSYLAMCARDAFYRPHLYPGKGDIRVRLVQYKTLSVFFGGK